MGHDVRGIPRDHDRAFAGSRRGLDLAEGILIGWRRYPPTAAFEELVDVASRHALSVSAVALALVSLAIGDADVAAPSAAATLAAQRQWSDQLVY
ncbi:hypothetical protein MMAD_05980 [Mycolicibacterium madagascariense]|jgi:hypothetical protein|uniref:ANTAR domain-containing protein n=1 Tax=Mycolicibacterium madagascariense TaxID=212765 RepID=A0A7I7XBI9_9MYCO|nr:ANTAR domain-containing protein [Mycolicibacterium madagascariense]MCV7011844.1 ANTAR domain-containing protein [Mycolicibacterium madagascariense]BBZ26303.1 hypothetical protein MMAD_05980 [Mycolicibacterium madagascariense]